MTNIQHENPAVQKLSSTSGPVVDISDDEQNQDVALAEPAEQLNDQNKPETTRSSSTVSTVSSNVEGITVQQMGTAQQQDSEVQTTSLG